MSVKLLTLLHAFKLQGVSRSILVIHTTFVIVSVLLTLLSSSGQNCPIYIYFLVYRCPSKTRYLKEFSFLYMKIYWIMRMLLPVWLWCLTLFLTLLIICLLYRFNHWVFPCARVSFKLPCVVIFVSPLWVRLTVHLAQTAYWILSVTMLLFAVPPLTESKDIIMWET